MDVKSQVTEPAVEPTAPTEEKKTFGQKIIDAVTGKGKTNPATPTAEEPTAEDKADDPEEKGVITVEQMNEAIEKAKQDAVADFQKQQEEEKRKASLTPEELKAEEDEAKDKRLSELEHEILVRDCKDNAIKKLNEAGYSVELADILDYSSKEASEKSLKTVMTVFANCLEDGIKERLKGKTPLGLNANNDINEIQDRQAKMRMAMGIKQK